MAAYINGIGNISPQNTFGAVGFLENTKAYTSDKLTCIEPDYTPWIDAKQLRRMSKIIRIGVASALYALKETQVEKPDAIITGTAYGCLEDTGTFLTKIVTNQEQALPPTPFIQSTHNTIGSQVALLLQAHGYNQTYSQRGFSFENALLDALTSIDQHQNMLVGGVDELTDLSYSMFDRFSLFKKENISSSDLYNQHTKGTILGEGATYFLLSESKSDTTYACIKEVATFYKPKNNKQLSLKIKSFLSQQNLEAKDIDLIITGNNGDKQRDTSYNFVLRNSFPNISTVCYKHLCGEYPTSNAFALWLASRILKEGKIPSALVHSASNLTDKLERILIYNQSWGDHHSFILVEKC